MTKQGLLIILFAIWSLTVIIAVNHRPTLQQLAKSGAICKVYGHHYVNKDFDHRYCIYCDKPEPVYTNKPMSREAINTINSIISAALQLNLEDQ